MGTCDAGLNFFLSLKFYWALEVLERPDQKCLIVYVFTGWQQCYTNRSLMVAGFALDAIGWRVVQLLHDVNNNDSSLLLECGGNHTNRTVITSKVTHVTTGSWLLQHIQHSGGQECDYKGVHWSDCDKYKLESGQRRVEHGRYQPQPPPCQISGLVSP
jgi:hypothetical protein